MVKKNARKRELTVEKWSRLMERNAQEAKEMGAFEFIRAHDIAGHNLNEVVFELQMARIWKILGMQVYDFDPDFTESLLGEKWMDLLPDCIGNRPLDCFYMKLPCESRNEGVVVFIAPSTSIDGFRPDWFPNCYEKGVHIGGRRGYERAVVNTGSEILCLCSFAIPKTIDLMFDDTVMEPYPAALVANGVAYLCSANADIVPVYVPRSETRKNRAKRRSMATWSDVGYRVGSELRSYRRSSALRSEGLGGTVRPHMRRAHWHHYWTGPRDGDRKLVLKWIPPVMVNVGDIDVATVHKVG